MSAAEMEDFPAPLYGENEWIYKKGRGFIPLGLRDYLRSNGLAYNTVWSIGCPFHCSYCGNTKCIANDSMYKKIRHPSTDYVVNEVKAAVGRYPHISTICFHDDSFMPIPYPQLEEFAVRWREAVNIPFAVYGVIPNYVRRDKVELLTWAGMNRVRLGIQSGSQRILDFYKRPTPVEKIEAAVEVCASFSPRTIIPPAYDFIVDNPIETKQDVVDTLELCRRLARPYTMNLFSLRVIPNTDLEKAMREEGVDIEEISSNYITLPPTWSNIMMYLLALWRPPRWLFDRLLKRVEPSGGPQKHYPVLAFLFRLLFLIKRGFDHLRFMDFSTIPGYFGYLCWKTGIISGWRKLFDPRPQSLRRKDSIGMAGVRKNQDQEKREIEAGLTTLLAGPPAPGLSGEARRVDEGTHPTLV